MAWLMSVAIGIVGGLILAWLVSQELERRSFTPMRRIESIGVVLATITAFSAVMWRFLDAHVSVLIAYLFLGALCVAVAAIDLKIHKIPNRFLFPSFGISGVLLSLATVFGGDWLDLGRALGCALLGYGLFYLLSLTGGMGLGDVKFAAILGAYCGWLGWSTAGNALILGFITGGVWALILVIARRAHRQTAIAFGPWLCVGGVLGILTSG